MLNKKGKNILLETGLTALLILFLAINKVLAVTLEAVYPEIAGHSVTASTELPAFVTYILNVGWIVGSFAIFIGLAWAGVLYLLSPINSSYLSEAKERVVSAISGLLILTLTYLIATTINPQLNVFKLEKLPPPTSLTVKIGSPGVYFYKDACPGTNTYPYTSSVADFGKDLRNQINSVNIVPDVENNTYYISTLFEQTNFWGKCQYINPNANCQDITPFASSASIYKFNPEPNGDGVYFYRKSCFDNILSSNVNDLVAQCNKSSGGYLKVGNSEIKTGFGKSFYIRALGDLKFTNVPESEKQCVKYDKDGNCTSRTEQSLAGENISSIIINGNYVVLLIYFNPQKDDPEGLWTSCQEFPTPNDENKLGPQQIKWEQIRNTGGVIPNYMIIFPVK